MVDRSALPSEEIRELHSGWQTPPRQHAEACIPSVSIEAPPEPKRPSGMGETLCFWKSWDDSEAHFRAVPLWKAAQSEPILHPSQSTFPDLLSHSRSPRKKQGQASSPSSPSNSTLGSEAFEKASRAAKTRKEDRNWGTLAAAEALAEATEAAKEAANRGVAATPASAASLDLQVVLRSRERLKRMMGLGQIALLRTEMKLSYPNESHRKTEQQIADALLHAGSAIKAMAAQRNELQKMRQSLEEVTTAGKKAPRKVPKIDSLCAKFEFKAEPTADQN